LQTRFRQKIADLEGLRPLTEPPPRYGEWLQFHFGRLVPFEPGIDLFDHALASAEFAASDAEFVDLFEVTMRRSGTDLVGYTDEVVGKGLQLLLDPGFSTTCQRIRTAGVAGSRKASAIAAISHLYDDVLAKRCAPVLGHLSEEGGEPALSYICYMMWDLCPLAHNWGFGAAGPIADAVIGVLERALESDNDAVVESALHGLGHLERRTAAREIIERFLLLHPAARPELRAYGEAAASGCVL
jgi:hypothetical protein